MKTSLLFVAVFTVLTAVYGRAIRYGPGNAMNGVAHIAGSNFLVTDLYNQRITWYDLSSDTRATLIQGPKTENYQGLRYNKKTGYIFASGSGKPFADSINAQVNSTDNEFGYSFAIVKPKMHVFDLYTGKKVATCDPGSDGQLVNDVVIDWKSEYAYYTETYQPYVYRMKISALPKCEITRISLPSSVFGGPAPTTSGIAMYKFGLIVTNFIQESIWYRDLATGQSYEIVGKSDKMVGLRVIGNKCLLAASNSRSVINVYRLSKMNGKVTATFKYDIKDPSLDEPATFDTWGRNILIGNFNAVSLGANQELPLTTRRIRPLSTLC